MRSNEKMKGIKEATYFPKEDVEDDDGPPPGFESFPVKSATDKNKKSLQDDDDRPPPGFHSIQVKKTELGNSSKPSEIVVNGHDLQFQSVFVKEDEKSGIGSKESLELGFKSIALNEDGKTGNGLKSASIKQDEKEKYGCELRLRSVCNKDEKKGDELKLGSRPFLVKKVEKEKNVGGDDINKEKIQFQKDDDDGPPPGWSSVPPPRPVFKEEKQVIDGLKLGSQSVPMKEKEKEKEKDGFEFQSRSFPVKGKHIRSRILRKEGKNDDDHGKAQVGPQQLPSATVSRKSQMVCCSCWMLLSYNQGAKSVQCSTCQTVNLVLELHQVGQIKCGNCAVLLRYPYEVPSVKCPSCFSETKIGDQNKRSPLSTQQARRQSVQEDDDDDDDGPPPRFHSIQIKKTEIGYGSEPSKIVVKGHGIGNQSVFVKEDETSKIASIKALEKDFQSMDLKKDRKSGNGLQSASIEEYGKEKDGSELGIRSVYNKEQKKDVFKFGSQSFLVKEDKKEKIVGGNDMNKDRVQSFQEDDDDGPPPGWSSVPPPRQVIKKGKQVRDDLEVGSQSVPMKEEEEKERDGFELKSRSFLVKGKKSRSRHVHKEGKNDDNLRKSQGPAPPQPRPSAAASGKSQMVCCSCRMLLSYNQGAKSVQCSFCQTVNLLVLEPHQVGQVKCGNCAVLLTYPYGAPEVKCSFCLFVTKVGDQNKRLLLFTQQTRRQSFQEDDDDNGPPPGFHSIQVQQPEIGYGSEPSKVVVKGHGRGVQSVFVKEDETSKIGSTKALEQEFQSIDLKKEGKSGNVLQSSSFKGDGKEKDGSELGIRAVYNKEQKKGDVFRFGSQPFLVKEDDKEINVGGDDMNKERIQSFREDDNGPPLDWSSVPPPRPVINKEKQVIDNSKLGSQSIPVKGKERKSKHGRKKGRKDDNHGKSAEAPQPLPSATASGKGQMVCGTCRILLSYTKGSRFVQCSTCQTVNLVLEPDQVGQVKCGSCAVKLMYPYGAPSVQCSSCLFVTKIRDHNKRPPLSRQRARRQ